MNDEEPQAEAKQAGPPASPRAAAEAMVKMEGTGGPTERVARAMFEATERRAAELESEEAGEPVKPMTWAELDDDDRQELRVLAAELIRDGHLHAGRPKPVVRDRNKNYVPPRLRPDHHSGIVAEVGRPRNFWQREAPSLIGGALGIVRAIMASPEPSGSDDDRSFWRALGDQARRWEANYRNVEELVAEVGQPKTVRVELAGADELNGGEAGSRFWADMSGDATHWSQFGGHLMQVDVELHTYNERDVNHWKGRDEIRAGGEWTLLLNRQPIADGYFGEDVGAALRQVDRWIIELASHPALDHRIATPYKEQLVGRKVWYERTPAVVSMLTGDGCVMLRVVGAEHFPPAVWEVEQAAESGIEPELDDEVKVELTSEKIWWWRREVLDGEPATQADWVEAERARREAEDAEACKFKVRGLDDFGKVVATHAVDLVIPVNQDFGEPERSTMVAIHVEPDVDPPGTPTEGALWERESGPGA
jgi:hypothetical protein